MNADAALVRLALLFCQGLALFVWVGDQYLSALYSVQI